MFNVDNIYDILNNNFLRPNYLTGAYLRKFGYCNDASDLNILNANTDNEVIFNLQNVYFYDQEPVYDHNIIRQMHNAFTDEIEEGYYGVSGGLLATSEKNNPKVDVLCKTLHLSPWYYFYHAFASLDWFRSIKYLPQNKNIWQGASYISMNNLYKGPRIYRLVFLSKLYKQGLLGEGMVSYNIDDWVEELDNMHLNYQTREDIINFCKQAKTSYRVQSSYYNKDNSSAEQEYPLWTSAFWHIVSETCFYEKTIHLTEKIFKPIVARQPFLLLSTPGALKYLKGYGFETFNNFIDESYDEERDHNLRLKKIVDQVNYISNLTSSQKKEMYHSMTNILEHNFNHFYNNLGNIAWQELKDNFTTSLSKSNELSGITTKNKKLLEKIEDHKLYSRIPSSEQCLFVNSILNNASLLGTRLKKLFK